MSLEILTIIVLLNVVVTAALWRARKPEKLKKKFLGALLHGKPIVPEHNPPNIIGEGFSSQVDQSDRLFFGHFADFGAVVNQWLSTMECAWRLQELPTTELSLGFWDQPMFGRCYDIFHNQIRLGRLEVRPGVRYSAETPDVYADIELQWVRLLAYGSIAEFLSNIALYVCNPDQATREYFEVRVAIQSAITRVLWRTQQIEEIVIDATDYGELELQLNGSAEWYFERRQAPRNQSTAAPAAQ